VSGPGRGPAHVVVPLDDGDVEFTVHGLTRSAWAELIHAHPTADARWRFDAQTLYPELLRLCVTNPILSPELATTLVEDPDTGGDLVEVALQLTEPGSLEWAKHRLSTDGRLAAEVALCVRMGIAHDAFTRWAPASQDLALAHAELAADTCPGCGVAAQDMGDRYAWEPDTRGCVHCESLEQHRAGIPDDARHYVHVRLIRPRDGDG
jgi:hypothetical protein